MWPSLNFWHNKKQIDFEFGSKLKAIRCSDYGLKLEVGCRWFEVTFTQSRGVFPRCRLYIVTIRQLSVILTITHKIGFQRH